MRSLIGKLHELNVGMSCIIETFNGQYVATGLLPLSTDSLHYGSNTIGVHISKRDKDCEQNAYTLSQMLNLKRHLIAQLCDSRQIDMFLPYNVQIHIHHINETTRMFVIHMVHKLWVKYTAEIYLRPEIMLNYSSAEMETGYEQYTWKNPVKCNECGKYIEDYEYYSYEKYSYGDRRVITFQYFCCLSCYARLLPSRNYKVPFNKIVRKSLPTSMRLIHWRNVNTGEIVMKPPTKKIPLNPDAFDSLSSTDPNHTKDKATLSNLFSSIRNEFVDELINDLNTTQDYMLLDAEHLARLAHSKGINVRFLGRLTFQASCNYVREIAVILILSRSIKHIILDALNRVDSSDDPREVILSYINHILTIADTNTSKLLWEQLSEYIRANWDVSVEKTVLGKLHMPALAISVCKQLHITFHRFFEANYLALAPFTKGDLVLKPVIIDEPYVSQSLDLVLAKARTLDKKGRRSQWNLKGGPERTQATEYYDKAVRIAATIYEKNSLQYADTALEYATHLESLHEEAGNPLNSKWNRAAQIPPSKYSELGLFFFEDALKIYECEKLQYKNSIECLLGLSRLSAATDVFLYMKYK